jgi:hypothetical protein
LTPLELEQVALFEAPWLEQLVALLELEQVALLEAPLLEQRLLAQEVVQLVSEHVAL